MNNVLRILGETHDEDAQPTLNDFLAKRKEGASKVQATAEKTGGPATLTAIHFKAKEKPYTEVLSHIDRDKLLSHVLIILKHLTEIESLTQTQFQTLTGQLEVYGETYIAQKELELGRPIIPKEQSPQDKLNPLE